MDLYLEKLASKAPTPGGGSAAALAGALGASLASMVCEIADNTLADEAKELAKKLRACMERDEAAYAAFKSCDGDKEHALLLAAEAPFETLRLCCECIALHEKLRGQIRESLLPDVASGAVLAWGAMYAAAINVRANTKLLRDRETAQRLNAEADALMGKYWVIADNTYEEIFKIYS